MKEDDSTPRKFGIGAIFPPHLTWQQGLTVASINFVQDVERVIESLIDMQDNIKSGIFVLYDSVKIEMPKISGLEEAQKAPSVEIAHASFARQFMGGNVFMIGIGVGGIEVYVDDINKAAGLPRDFEGYKVAVTQKERPVLL